MGQTEDLIELDTDTSDDEPEVTIDEAIDLVADVVTGEEEARKEVAWTAEAPIEQIRLRLQSETLNRDSSLEFSSALVPPPPPPPPPSALIAEAIEYFRLPTICRVCRQSGEPRSLLLCAGCGRGGIYHKECWDHWPDHKPGANAAMWDPCEKVDYVDFAWMAYLFNSNISPKKQKSLHRKDLWATWFGVPSHQWGPLPCLYTYSRLQSLLSEEIATDRPQDQFPSLISFFGDTGGGKSTLINALIKNTGIKGQDFETPVPGNQADMEKSTSGDVHLYADPRTISTETPLFYADCEGLRGNHRSVATQLASNKNKEYKSLQRGTLRNANDGFVRSYADDAREHQRTTSHKLPMQWGRLTRPPPSQTQGMYGDIEQPHIEYETAKAVVTELYPRLLYTFSDVVCFITNNVKASESDIMEMFKWAQSGHERTTNQRIRPGLVIVINKLPAKADPQWLDVDFATDRLLKTFHLSGAFDDLRTQWANRGRPIQTAQDLIECYYDSFRVVCIPDLILKDAKSATALSKQLNILYQEIRLASARLRQKRLKVGMNLNLESFNTYVDHAFNRLTKELRAPIDFYFLSSQDPVIPSRLSEHMMSIVVKMLKDAQYGTSNETGQEQALMSRLTPYLASCIAMRIPSGMKAQERKDKIAEVIDEVQLCLQKCREKHWRCEAKSGNGRRCINRWNGHEKGHQYDSPAAGPLRRTTSLTHDVLTSDSRPSLRVGRFEHCFDANAVVGALFSEIARLLELDDAPRSLALSQSARSSGVAAQRSNRTCLTCLANCPIYILPCTREKQHTICEDCASRFSLQGVSSSAVLTLERCPLDCPFEVTPWRIRKKPSQAGVRILTLDGGGIRGVVELRILRALTSKVGHNIPIQELFDLAMGTSTGGIIALGLFKMDWTLEQATQKFHELVRLAFSPRELLSVPGFKNVAQLFCSWRSKPEGIEGALRKAFGKDELFAQKRNATADRVKVAVVAGVQESAKVYLFSNYSRNPTADDRLLRSDNPDDDFRTWQAGRATSAAPIYFQPYYHRRTRRHYVDGALRRNNPIRVADEERRLIWKDSLRRPDVVISVGTGVQTTASGAPKPPNAFSKRETLRRMLPRGMRKNVATAYDMVQSTLNCENEWSEFVQSHRHDANFNSVCFRLNVNLDDKPPKMDNVDMMVPLEVETKLFLADSAPMRQRLEHIAARLLASLFYFVEHIASDSQTATTSNNARTIRGQVECRLSPSMTTQFSSIVNVGLSLRVCDAEGQRDIAMPKFNMQTFTSERIEFLVSPGAKNWRLEVRFNDREMKWERLSGFS